MSEIKQIQIDEKRAKRLLQKIVMMEKTNIVSKQDNDTKMVDKIKKMIEEGVECF